MIALTPEEELTIQTYDRIGQGWNLLRHNLDFWQAELEKFSQLLSRGRVLDLGCGGGRGALFFVKHKPEHEYVGIDLSTTMLEEARVLVPDFEYFRMSMYELGFRAAAFDGFLAVASLPHIPKARIQIVLEEIKRVVKPGGPGFIALREGRGEQIVEGRAKCDKRFFSFYALAEFMEILTANGFQILERTVDMRQYTPSRKVWLLYSVKTPSSI